ncbi:MAG: CopD family protein [Nitrospirae bacterium]|nr:CopD family protein [Nitrospirota bacterium]
MKHIFFTGFLFVFLCLSLPSLSYATPEFAQKTGLACTECHVNPAGGRPLTEKGRKYLEELQAKQHYRPITRAQRIVRLFIGYFHIMAAIIWFGAIIYVHLLLKPAYAVKGLPRGEMRLGWISMIVVLITGILLTIARMPSLQSFYTTRFGLLLSIKIALFAVMFLSALIVTIFIGPRLRTQRKAAVKSASGTYTPDELAAFDGKEGRPAYVAYKGVVYDLTQSRLWKGGSHLRKHNAGQDMTDLLKTAPHGEEKVLAMPVAGNLLLTAKKLPMPFHQRLFYVFAYMNLVLTFVIVFIVALWRWW